MANKKITDLQARSDFDDTCNLPAHDAVQTWRVTGAQIKTWILTFSAAITRSMLAVGAVARSTVTAITGTTTAATTTDVYMCDATSGAFTVTLPTAVGISGKIFEFFKTDASANAVTIDGNSTETIGLSLTRALAMRGDSIEIISDGANWQVRKNNSTNEVFADGSAGYGSTNLTTLRLATSRRADGTAVTFADSASLGATFTVNEPGLYAITGSCGDSSGVYIAISINGTQLAAGPVPMTYAQGLRALTSGGTTYFQGSMSFVTRLAVGDIIRLQGNGASAPNSSRVSMGVTKVRE